MYTILFFLFIISIDSALPRHPLTRNFTKILVILKERILASDQFGLEIRAVWELILVPQSVVPIVDDLEAPTQTMSNEFLSPEEGTTTLADPPSSAGLDQTSPEVGFV